MEALFIGIGASLTTTAIIGAMAWLVRELIATRLRVSVQHEFDQKLESLRSDFRISEDKVKYQLAAREAEISALRDGALTAVVARRAATDKRRLEAVDQLWDAFTRVSKSKYAASMVYTLKFEAAAEEAARNPKFKELIDTLVPGDPQKIDYGDAAKARLHVTSRAWILFAAHAAIIGAAMSKLILLRSGLTDAPRFFDHDAVVSAVEAALPHQKSWLEEYKDQSLHLLLPEIEKLLEQELRSIIGGSDVEIDTIVTSAALSKLAAQLSQPAEQEALRSMIEKAPPGVVATPPPAPRGQ